jgi:phage baseplate assembly protein W
MSVTKFLGIRFPFKNSNNGFYFDLTKSTKEQVKSNLIHLLLTKKGNRLYKPDFGCNLVEYLFEPADTQTIDMIKSEIISTVQSNMQGINIDSVNVEYQDHTVSLDVLYSYNNGAFLVKDILNLKL